MANFLKTDITPDTQAKLLQLTQYIGDQMEYLSSVDREAYTTQLNILRRFIKENPESRSTIQGIVSRLIRQEIRWRDQKEAA
jgi:hypothetical protein